MMKVGDLVRQIGWEGLGIVTVIGEGRYRITTVFWTDRGDSPFDLEVSNHFFEDLELISECR
jgi:hypothetical protein